MVRQVSTADILASPYAAELLKDYAAECSIPLIGQINPQPEIYAALEQAGVLTGFGFYEGKRLVGFGTVLTTILPHYGKKVATVESIYAKRGGKDLMEAIEAYARGVGCVAIFYSAPAGGRLEDLLLLKKNFSHTNTIFCKGLAC